MTTIDTKAIRERAASAFKVLVANAEGCAVNHYGEDLAVHGRPQWLADAHADLDALFAELDRLRAELVAKDALLAEARGLISDQIESESEFQTEWDQSARAFLAKLKEQE